MSNKALRNVTRLIHLIIGVCIGVFIYSPFQADPGYITFMQVVVMPVATITGVVLWQQPRIVKLFRRAA